MSTEHSYPTVADDSVTEPESDSRLEFLINSIEQDEDQIDDSYVNILSEYAKEIDPKLMRHGWSVENAKSSKYKLYDQSMLEHIRTGSFFFLRFFGDLLNDEVLEGRGDREQLLREGVAMFVIHDIHKLAEDDGWRNEFDITKDIIEEFVTEIGLDEFAPTLTIDDFHSVAVGHHLTDNSKLEMLSSRFTDLAQLIRLADSVASITDPDEFMSERTQKTFHKAVPDESTLHAHTVEDGGAFASIINKATAHTFEEYGYTLATIHNNGCTYLDTTGTPVNELPAPTDEFLDLLYQNVLDELRKSLPQYRNRSILFETAQNMGGQGHYQISDLDILCLTPRDLLRAIVEKGMDQSDYPFEIPAYAETALDELHEMTGIEFDQTFRIEGVARIVHTVYTSIIPHITGPNGEPWEQNQMAATLAAFSVSPDMQSQIAELYKEHGEQLGTGAEWSYKYLIAHDVLTRGDYFLGETGSETIESITDDLSEELQDFSKWSNYRRNRVGAIDNELRALVYRRLRIDDDPLYKLGGTPSVINDYMGKNKHECGFCSGPTTADRLDHPALIEAKLSVPYEDKDAEYWNVEVEYKGELIELKSFFHENRLCYNCQLDVELQAADTSWTSTDNYLHVAVKPEYSYTPISGITLANVIDKFSSLGLQRGSSFARDVFLGETNDHSAYDEWMAIHAENAYGRKLLANPERGFMLGSGYGGHTISFPLPNGNQREALFSGAFTACVAAAYSGLSLYLSSHPVIRPPDEDTLELVQFSPLISEIRPIFGADTLPLAQIQNILQSTSSIRKLGRATGHGHAPVDAYCAYKRNKTIPLVGSQMLVTAEERGSDPVEYADEAMLLDAHASKQDVISHDFVRNARMLGDYAVDILDYPDDPENAREFIISAIDVVVTNGRTMDSEDLAQQLIAYTESHEYVDLEAFDAIDDIILEFAYALAETVFDVRHHASTESLAVAREPIGDGVWAHTIAVTAGEREIYREAQI